MCPGVLELRPRKGQRATTRCDELHTPCSYAKLRYSTAGGHLLRVVSDVGGLAPLPQQEGDHGGVDKQEQPVPADGYPKGLRPVELEQNRQPDAARGVSSGSTDWGKRGGGGQQRRDGRDKE